METELILIENPNLGRDDIFDEYDDGEDEDEEIFVGAELLTKNKPRRKSMSNPSKEESSLGMVALLGVVGYLFWCGIVWKETKIWSWKPWEVPKIIEGRRLARLSATKQSDRGNGYNSSLVTLITP